MSNAAGIASTKSSLQQWVIANRPTWHTCRRRCVFRRRELGRPRIRLGAVGFNRTNAEVDGFYRSAVLWTRIPERCFVADDQVAYIPAQFAAVYFDSADTGAHRTPARSARLPRPARGSHFAAFAGMAACQWPEGVVTCRLLEAGVRLAMLDADIIVCKGRNCRVGAAETLCRAPPAPAPASEAMRNTLCATRTPPERHSSNALVTKADLLMTTAMSLMQALRPAQHRAAGEPESMARCHSEDHPGYVGWTCGGKCLGDPHEYNTCEKARGVLSVHYWKQCGC